MQNFDQNAQRLDDPGTGPVEIPVSVRYIHPVLTPGPTLPTTFVGGIPFTLMNRLAAEGDFAGAAEQMRAYLATNPSPVELDHAKSLLVQFEARAQANVKN